VAMRRLLVVMTVALALAGCDLGEKETSRA
jgi:hypothetical protein